MGRSIYQQLIDGKVEVDHNGETLIGVKLPEWMRDIGAILAEEETKEEEEAGIMKVLAESGVFSGFLSLGLQQAVVGFRAKVRPADIPHASLKGERVKVSIVADGAESRKRGVEYKPNDLQRPERELTEDEKNHAAAQLLIAAGYSVKKIEDKLA